MPKNIMVPEPIARRINGLRRRRAVRELNRAAAELDLPVWIVGGAVRDLWLDRPVHDVDAAVAGDAEPLARLLESRGVGRLVPLSLDPPRVFRLAGPGTELDVAELWGGSIEKDLARRDFTANAIALPLPRGGPVDPFGGAADLGARKLRAVCAENFRDDPVRSLRAARFFATHGLLPDRATSRICRATAGGLAGVAAERIRDELANLLEARRAGPALGWAARFRLLGPALGVALSPGIGARHVRGETFDAPAIVRLQPKSRLHARLALLGLAQGLTPAETSRWLAARRWSREDAGSAGALAGLAETARTLSHSDDIWRWIRDAGPRALAALAVLEAQGQAGRRRARGLRRRLASAHAIPHVRGRDLLAWLNLPAGPAVGKLLGELEIAGLSGRVRTRRQARKWLAANAPAIIRSS
jgi:tRNA nucleotidyltransferase/poly(A) polymerase